MRSNRFHGRFDHTGQECQHPDCAEPGEFRAPSGYGNSFDGPGAWRWFCLDHVREFNAGYDWFEGMSADEILAAQSPMYGWQTETPAFKPTAGVDGTPRWADFSDPLDAIGARMNGIKSRAERAAKMAMAERQGERRFSREEAEALHIMGLGRDADRKALRRRYSDLVRRYHPDRNGGNRAHEARLTRVVEAYQLLRKSSVFVEAG